MSYIGNTPTQQNFVAGADQFSGNGSTTAFTLSRNVNTVFDIFVAISNVPQDPYSAYSVSGNTLTFTSAPPSGTGNIYVTYRATNVQTFLPALGSIGKAQLDIANFNGTGAAIMPVGTTAQRPGTPQSGMFRLNSSTGNPEWYDTTTSAWITFSEPVTYSIQYLVIAGGGAGGAHAGSGAGAGGYRNSVTGELSGGSSTAESPVNVIPNTDYTVIVGAGGAAVVNANGPSGSSSSISGVGSSGLSVSISTVGGAGGRGGASDGAGFSGGSGSGGASPSSAQVGGSGTAGQGTNGGTNSSNWGTGGGGGAGTAGANGSGSNAGAGGSGLSSSITGSAVTRAGGGGGSAQTGSSGAGGSGGGGGGSGSTGGSGTANTGSGGGGCHSSTAASGSGGSGIVIIRYLGAQRGTGGTVTSSGGYTIHTFTTSGTYTA